MERSELHAYIGGVIEGQGGVPVCVGGVTDHVHILLGLNPSHRLADVMREVKLESSRWIKESKRLPTFSWQKGYGVFTVSPLACEKLRANIESQENHHPDLV